MFLNIEIIYTVLVFILADVVTGIVKSFKNKNFTSTIMREGFFHKFAEVISIMVVYAAQYLLPNIGVNIGDTIFKTFAAYIVIMEIGSIIENIGAVNPSLTAPLSSVFDKLNSKGE